MLNAIVELSLRYKLLVLLAFVLIVFVGVRAVQTRARRRVPRRDAGAGQHVHRIPRPRRGRRRAAADRSRSRASMAGLPGVEQIRSVSLFGLSYVAVYFRGRHGHLFRAPAREREAAGGEGTHCREGYGEPTLGPNSSGLGQVFWYTVESADRKLSAMDLRTLQDWTRTAAAAHRAGRGRRHLVGRRREAVPGARSTRAKLIKYGLTFKSVMEALAANNRQVGGQYVNLGREQYLVRGLGLVANTRDIGGIVVAERNGTPIYVRDVARGARRAGDALRRGHARRQGGGARDRARAHQRERQERRRRGQGEARPARSRRCPPASRSIRSTTALTSSRRRSKRPHGRSPKGAVLVAIVLFLFLGEMRSAMVVIVTLPVAMLIAFILMQQFGLSANLMSLAGLAIGIGMMVDGAVVMVENAFPPARAPRPGRAGRRTHVDPRGGARSGESDRVRDPHHHRRVPAAVFARQGWRASSSSPWPTPSASPWRGR